MLIHWTKLLPFIWHSAQTPPPCSLPTWQQPHHKHHLPLKPHRVVFYERPPKQWQLSDTITSAATKGETRHPEGCSCLTFHLYNKTDTAIWKPLPWGITEVDKIRTPQKANTPILMDKCFLALVFIPAFFIKTILLISLESCRLWSSYGVPASRPMTGIRP